jgi:hypothetical protein
VGTGGSHNAEYTLKAGVPAGTYALVCDGIIIAPVDVQFDLLHLRGETETVLATAMRHFDPLPDGNFDAQPCDIAMPAPAIEFEAGDHFVFRYTGTNSTNPNGYVPNGEGNRANGRIPNITLP